MSIGFVVALLVACALVAGGLVLIVRHGPGVARRKVQSGNCRVPDPSVATFRVSLSNRLTVTRGVSTAFQPWRNRHE